MARTPEEWSAALALAKSVRVRPFAAKQVFEWIHKRCVMDASAMTNLPAPLRAELQSGGLVPPARLAREHRSSDGTRKLLVELGDGATIESVLIPMSRPHAEIDADAAAADDEGDDDEDEDEDARLPAERITQCISTQVGCAMGCVFCASGVAGLKRHLGPEEIVGQVLLGRSLLDEGQVIRNVVLMGMGEPLHNYDATARALRLLTRADGIALSKRRVTVSTSGLIPEIRRLGEDFQGQIGLAVSLHAADDASRSALMPVNRRYPLAELIACLREYPLPRRRRITIEYTLVRGKNDDPEEARRLARLLSGLRVKVNLIPMNPIEHSDLGPPPAGRVDAFQRVLVDKGLSCFVRKRRGDDVSAACGQLVLIGAKPKVKGFKRPAREP